MYPQFTIFGYVLPSYSVMGVTGCILAILLAVWICRSRHCAVHGSAEDAENILYIFVLSAVGAMIGAKILYILTVLPDFIRDVHTIFSDFDYFSNHYLSGGFVLYGGLIGGYCTACFYAKQFHVKLSTYYPALLPALALACGIGRIGCFLAGCCYGKVVPDCPIAVIFPQGSIAPAGVPLFPTQLLEAAADLLLCIFLFFFTNKTRFAYLGVHCYILLYSIIRFTIEFFRGDTVRGIWLGISTSQWISILLSVGTLIHSFFSIRRCRYLKSR